MAQVICKNCTNTVFKEDKRALFCSRKCSTIYNNKKHPKRVLEGNCIDCSVAIAKKLKYCSPCKEKRKEAFVPKKRDPQKAVKSVTSWRQRVKIKAIEYKGGKCIRCSYFKCVAALQFHHTDPTQKDFIISGTSKSWDSIKVELDKCILICANCHAEEHDAIRKLSGEGQSRTD